MFKLNVGTKSLLVGAHQFFLHPIFVLWGWVKIYGWPKEFPIYVAILLHDIGYWGKTSMDGEGGKTHPELGAKLVSKLFDKWVYDTDPGCYGRFRVLRWRNFTLLHSRHYSKLWNVPHSDLCVADKMAFCMTPFWLYKLHMKLNPEEMHEYLTNSYKRIKDVMPNKWFGRIYIGGEPVDLTPFQMLIWKSRNCYYDGDLKDALMWWHQAVWRETMIWVLKNSSYLPSLKEKEKLL